jgi:hypothetical protein
LSEFLRDTAQDENYLAVAVFSLMAELDEKDAEEVFDEMAGMSNEDMMEYLKKRGLLKDSLTIRFEMRNDTGKNSLVTFQFNEDGSLGRHEEVFDHEISLSDDMSPFGGNIFEK